MAHLNDTILVQTLTESYRGQLDRYRSLGAIVSQLLGKLVLSRGDLSQVTAGFREKQAVLEAIEAERNRMAEMVEQWEKRKSGIGPTGAADELDTVLQQVTDAIRNFLNNETQLQQYLEGIISRSRTGSG
jgi:hypothetical protein